MIENPNPGPWKLVSPERGWPDGDSIGHIEDANGNAICDFGDGAQYYPTEGSPPSEPAATLMLAAPEMEDLLREQEAKAPGICQCLGSFPAKPPSCHGCRRRALLARFDEARAKTVIQAKEDAERAERNRLENERLTAARAKEGREGPVEPYKYSGAAARRPTNVKYQEPE